MAITKRIEETAADGVAIGDFVKLKKPILGYPYGQVKGFLINKDKQGVGPAHPMPFLGGQVDKFKVTLKKSPLFTTDYGHDADLPRKAFDKLGPRERDVEIQLWNAKQKR